MTAGTAAGTAAATTVPNPPRATARAAARRGWPISAIITADDETIARAKGGDHAAWRALYQSHAGRLVVWLDTQPTRDAGVGAEDVAADAWLTAARKIADFDGTADDFAGWLFGIARLLLRNAQRRTTRRRTSPTSVEILELTSPDSTPAASTGPDSEGWVAWLLGHLPERERQVVACLDVVGLDVASTCAALGMSASAVRVARHRGLRRLRSLGVVITA